MSLPKQSGYRRTTETRSRANASEYKDYLEKKKVDGLDIYYEGCGRDWDKDFMTIATEHKKLNNNVAIEYVESWSPDETKRIGTEQLFEQGISNAKKAFPNHSFVVVPHENENGCFHTHVLFCRVSNDGITMKSDWKNRSIWNQTCDKTSREKGLSTVEKTTSKQRERLSKSARQSQKRGKIPYQLQIMQKADFARRVATNINEFVSFMGDLGINVHDRGRVLTYTHPAREKGVRGRNLGENYKKENLIEQFKANRNEQQTRPNLKKYLTDQIGKLHNERGHLVGDKSSFPFHSGGHQKFEKQASRQTRSSKDIGDNGINHKHFNFSVYDSIRSSIVTAKKQSIPEYCKANKIALNEKKDGSFTLKGREYIHIEGNKWQNLKERNGKRIGTQGSLIEFVANHKKLSLLESIADITDNKSILLLQQYLGKEERTYKEFSIPFSNRKKEDESIFSIGKLLKKMGYKSEFSRFIYRTKKVQAARDGAIRFLMGDKAQGAVEFKQNKDGSFLKTFLGSKRHGFLKQSGSSKKASVFKDPFTFMNETGGKGVMSFKSNDNLLVLGDGNMEALDFFLANNKSVKEIDLLGFSSKDLSTEKQMELTKLGIKVKFLEPSGLSRSRSKRLSR